MPLWLAPILSFLGKRTLHFIVYAVIALAIWGVYHKVFVSATSSTKIGRIERQVNVYKSDEGVDIIPIIGCSAWRFHTKAYYQKPSKQINYPIKKEGEISDSGKNITDRKLLDSLAFWRRI